MPFEADLVWPAVGQPGSYTVAAYECRGGSVAGRAAVTLEVVRGGVAAGLKRLADEHGGLYGALAVGVTMSLGFGIDFVLAGARRRRAIRRVKRAEAIARTDVATH